MPILLRRLLERPVPNRLTPKEYRTIGIKVNVPN